ncbi:DUF4326 domain-containing protein [Microbispora sp. NBC_01189]|uniref:DUF4326 domain-containing protein n=1 Tax=Microbispora sp. NBC_01189 TaxID=2903583 RepID=UPI002E103CFE|nr:DUF4326 domain-containing protein [Microbispora sp. NBC_01189]
MTPPRTRVELRTQSVAPRRVKVEGDRFHGRVPEGAVYVGRAAPGLRRSPFANPHTVGKFCRECGGQVHDQAAAVEAYRRHLRKRPELVERARAELAGRNLACWCRPGEPCHVDVLLAVVPGEEA